MALQFAIAIACKLYTTHTGVGVIDFFSKYYVFFLVGHFGRDIWFQLAETARQNKGAASLVLPFGRLPMARLSIPDMEL